MPFKNRLFVLSKTLTVVLTALLLFSACSRNVLFTSNKSIAMPATATASDTTAKEKILMPDDKVMISIWDHEELSVGNLQGNNGLDEAQGKWLMIDLNGEVRLPQVGNVKLQGLTLREATVYLEKVYAKFIQNPVITLRKLNNQITVLGEVRNPGIYLFSTDNIRLIDVIGKAQGLTDFAKPQKIKVIRGTSEIVIDLTNSASVADKQLTIIPGDVIYVPPTNGKGWNRFSTKIIPIASLITAIALIYNITKSSNP